MYLIDEQCVKRDLYVWKRTRKRNLCVRKETCKRVKKMKSVSKETHMSVERDLYQRPLENINVCDAHTGGKDWSDPIEKSICTANPTWGEIFEKLFQSSKLKARTSVFTEMWQKKRSSFELGNCIRKYHLKWNKGVL